jgi:hypothetical protein
LGLHEQFLKPETVKLELLVLLFGFLKLAFLGSRPGKVVFLLQTPLEEVLFPE